MTRNQKGRNGAATLLSIILAGVLLFLMQLQFQKEKYMNYYKRDSDQVSLGSSKISNQQNNSADSQRLSSTQPLTQEIASVPISEVTKQNNSADSQRLSSTQPPTLNCTVGKGGLRSNLSCEVETNTTLFYPRPRPYDTITDCGCPYTCTPTVLHNVTDTSPDGKSCYDHVRRGLPRKGEEFLCSQAVSNKACPVECDSLRCPKPPLKDIPIAPLEPFTHHEGVVIVSKIMGWPVDTQMVLQSLCLMTAAYNDRVNYDIVVFSSMPQTVEMEEKFRSVLHPAKFRFVTENVTVPSLVKTMTPRRRDYILEKCNKTNVEDLTWDDNCPNIGKLRYNWQAEFRSLHLYKHPALAEYKYMIWMDADNYCTRPWTKDPLDFMVKNDLVFTFANFPAGSGGGASLQSKIKQFFGHHLCKVELQEGGVLHAVTGDCPNNRWQIVHGFFHISDLEFFRKNIDWLEAFIGEDRLSRNPDDQEAVVTASTLLAPGRVKYLEDNGIRLNIMHNGDIDGKFKIAPAMYLKWWPLYAERDFEAGFLKCNSYICCAGR